MNTPSSASLSAAAPLSQLLAPEILAKYDGLRVPRYTSYPTSPQFSPDIGPDIAAAWLAAVEPGAGASLYVHVPFCKAMCWYCGCHTKVVARYQPIADYLALLRREIDLVAAAVPGRLSVGHIHFGGGTPTMMTPGDLEILLAHLRARFDVAPGAEIAVEIDPRTLSQEMTGALGRAGVNRASLGVQDFDPDVQGAINRLQPAEMSARAVDWLRDAGVGHINLDLMYGLPRQTVDGVARSARQALALAPDRLAVFGYAHVPWMKTHQKRIDEAELPDGPGRWAQFAAIAATLTGDGYSPIGLDHFARPGDELAVMQAGGQLKRNFQGYTTDEAKVLLGFGASSIGALPQGYVQNAVPFDQWADAVAAGRLSIAKGLALSDDDRVRRDLIERLMCDLAVDVEAVAARHGAAPGIFDDALAELADLVTDGIAVVTGRRVSVPESARPLMRLVAARFDTYLATGAGRHSRAV